MLKEHQMSQFLTTPEAARMLNVNARTLERWRIVGNGPKYRVFGGLVRYALEDLTEWAAARTRQSTSDQG
ncbi:MAG: helix-turn-helix domain-containing protein [Syntrophobacteraceae bacterium]|jgi:excisionase family DNA binding protein